MDANALIQAELTRIENEAARQTRQLLAAQDSFIAAHVLLDLLKANGADEGLDVTPIYHGDPNGAAMVIYPGFHSDRTVTAIERADLTIDKVSEGFNQDTTRITVLGYPCVEVYVRRSAMEWQVAA